MCIHLGLTPQSVNKFGGYKVQGRDPAEREALIRDSLAAEQAGAAILLFECIPSDLMEEIMSKVSIPVIGIGAGPASDAQVLVMHDMLGVSPGRKARFVKDYMAQAGGIEAAFRAFAEEVETGVYPAPEHCYG